MTFEADLKTHLSHASITAIVEDRITPHPMPQAGSKPAITYTIPSDAPQTDLDGGDGSLNNIRVQIDCWHATHIGVKALAELVRIRMKTEANTFKAVPLPMFESYEPDTKLHRVSRDFSCWYEIS